VLGCTLDATTLQEEMNVLSSLKHPNIIRLIEVHFTNNIFFLIMVRSASLPKRGGSVAPKLTSVPVGKASVLDGLRKVVLSNLPTLCLHH